MKAIISYIIFLFTVIVIVIRFFCVKSSNKRLKSYIYRLFSEYSITLAEIKFSSSYGFPVYSIYFQTEQDFKKALSELVLDKLEKFLQSAHKEIKEFEIERAVNYYVLGDEFPRSDFRRSSKIRLQ